MQLNYDKMVQYAQMSTENVLKTLSLHNPRH